MRQYIIRRLLRWDSFGLVRAPRRSMRWSFSARGIRSSSSSSTRPATWHTTRSASRRCERRRASIGLFSFSSSGYVGHILQGNFGNSLVSGRSVNEMLVAAIPVTFQIGLTAIFITSIIGILLGAVAALNHNKWLDNVIVGFALFIWGIPVFVAGPLLMVFLVLVCGTEVPFGWDGLFAVKTLVPLVVIGLGPMAIIIRQARSGVPRGAERGLREDGPREGRARARDPAPPYPQAGDDSGREPDRPHRHRHAQ